MGRVAPWPADEIQAVKLPKENDTGPSRFGYRPRAAVPGKPGFFSPSRVVPGGPDGALVSREASAPLTRPIPGARVSPGHTPPSDSALLRNGARGRGAGTAPSRHGSAVCSGGGGPGKQDGHCPPWAHVDKFSRDGVVGGADPGFGRQPVKGVPLSLCGGPSVVVRAGGL